MIIKQIFKCSPVSSRVCHCHYNSSIVCRAPLTSRRMSTSIRQRIAKGSICIFFEMRRPKSSSVLMRMEPRREGLFMRRLLERVRPVCDLSLAASSSKETISPGTCSISDDSVLFAVWELQI